MGSEGEMNNHEVADVLAGIARIMEMEGEDAYKVRAYRKASQSIEALDGDVNEYFKEGRLRDIPGVGKSIGELLAELLGTGRSSLYESLKKEIPPELFEIIGVPGIGRKTAVRIHKALGVTTVEQFSQAARMHRIRKLKGMGEKAEHRILDSIERYRRREKETRIPLSRAMAVAEEALGYMRDCGFGRAEAAGSLRRWAPMVSDVNLMGAANGPGAVDCFLSSPLVAVVDSAVKGRARALTRYRVEATIEEADPVNWGLHLLFATGSKGHLEALVEHAAEQGISLSREGFVDAVTLERRTFASEAELYGALGLEYVPPELREGRGEVEAAASGNIPELIERADIRGDFHVHSEWSDGASSIQDIAMAARALGYEYVAICDHSRSLTIANGLSIERLREQMAEIDRINDTLENFTVLKGSEVDIKADGSLDLPDDVLEELDIVVASVHTGLRQEAGVMTERVVRALENPHVTILGHPTARLLGRREPTLVDIDAAIDVAVANGKALEVNAFPDRLDLSDENIKKAMDAGALISIDTDAHSLYELDYMEYGVHNARRGWAPKGRVLNTLSYDGLLKFLDGRL
jgi:DNA polymerase (family 10)